MRRAKVSPQINDRFHLEQVDAAVDVGKLVIKSSKERKNSAAVLSAWSYS